MVISWLPWVSARLTLPSTRSRRQKTQPATLRKQDYSTTWISVHSFNLFPLFSAQVIEAIVFLFKMLCLAPFTQKLRVDFTFITTRGLNTIPACQLQCLRTHSFNSNFDSTSGNALLKHFLENSRIGPSTTLSVYATFLSEFLKANLIHSDFHFL